MIKAGIASFSMAECSKCGKESMSFVCRYCGEKFCSEHRLPENHDCENLEQEIEKQREQNGKWFREKEVKQELKPKKVKQPSLFQDVLRSLKGNTTLSIILVTVFFYFLQVIPGVTELLFLNPAINQILQKPWSLVTVMLVHGSFFHIFANMITFYFFGSPLERTVGGKNLLKFYLASGIIASLGLILFQNVLFQLYGPTVNGIPTIGPAVGASGAVVAVFSAVAMLHPRAEVLLYFFIPMKIRTALYLFAGIEATNLLAKSVGIFIPVLGNFASSAHLTGLIVGVWYGRKLREKHSTQTGVLDLLGY